MDLRNYILNLLLCEKDEKLIVHPYNSRKEYLEKHPEILEYLNKKYPTAKTVGEMIYRLYYNINETPTCKCGKLLNFKNFSKGYYTYCSSKCAQSDSQTKEKIKHSFIQHYGSYNNEELVSRRKLTLLQKYGCENPMQNENVKDKVKNTNLQKYGTTCTLHNETIAQKTKSTNIERYGCENPMQNKSIKDKAKHTNVEKYGCENPMQNEKVKSKTKHTNVERYGYENVFQNEKTKQKIKQTNIKKYGVEHYSQTAYFAQKITNNSDVIQEKIIGTKRKNNTFIKSTPEEKCYFIILQKYPDVIRQYRSIQYPFNCDFYIPSKDLYIELNAHWTHGGHPFDKNNNDDLEKLNYWKSKHTKFYDIAVNTWTIRDIAKRETAYKNNLNYIELWSLKDLDNIL